MHRTKKSSQQHFLVEVHEGAKIEEVAAKIRSLGVHVQRIMPKVGVIDAEGPAAAFKVIRAVPGVTMVREDRAFQLPPFDERFPQ